MNSKLKTFNRSALKMTTLALFAACVSGRILAVEAVDVGDAYTQAALPTTPANSTTMVVSGSGSTLKRAWIKFDLNSVLPPGTTWQQVSKATLKLWQTTVATSGTVNVFSVTGTSWSETTLTHNTAPAVSGTAEGSFAVTTTGNFVTFNLTALVQDWVDGLPGGANNYGIVLVPATSTVNVTFDTKEATTTSHEPQLDIVLSTGTISASLVSGLSAVATSGSYASLLGTPAIPNNTSQLTNGAGYVTSAGSVSYASNAGTASALSGAIASSQVNGLAAVATAGTFASLLSPPTTLAEYGIKDPVLLSSGTYSNPNWLAALAYSKITGAPTNISLFTNDAGFIVSGGTTATLTISGTAYLTGSLLGTGTANILPNQMLSSGTASILTLGLADARYLTLNAAGATYLTPSQASGLFLPVNLQTLSVGLNSHAYGQYSTALGAWSSTSGNSSFAEGLGSQATREYSVAMGWYSSATGHLSFAFGDQTLSSNDSSTSMGYHTVAGGWQSTSMGHYSSAYGQASTSMGYYTTANGFTATSMGNSTTAQGVGQLVIGQFNVIQGSSTAWIPTDDLFIIGNGGDANNPSDAFVVKKNGDTTINGSLNVSSNVGVGTTDPQAQLHVAGNSRFDGPIRVAPQGDLDMGVFVSEPVQQLQSQQASLKGATSGKTAPASTPGTITGPSNPIDSGTTNAITSGTDAQFNQ